MISCTSGYNPEHTCCHPASLAVILSTLAVILSLSKGAPWNIMI